MPCCPVRTSWTTSAGSQTRTVVLATATLCLCKTWRSIWTPIIGLTLVFQVTDRCKIGIINICYQWLNTFRIIFYSFSILGQIKLIDWLIDYLWLIDRSIDCLANLGLISPFIHSLTGWIEFDWTELNQIRSNLITECHLLQWLKVRKSLSCSLQWRWPLVQGHCCRGHERSQVQGHVWFLQQHRNRQHRRYSALG